EGEFARFDGHPDTAAAFAAAGTRAHALAEAAGGGREAVRSAALVYAADALTGLQLERALPQRTVAEIVSTVASTAGCLDEAAALLAPVLERNMLLERNAEGERALLESGEKRLLRLGFDLHDGPIQDLVVLADDVRLAHSQVAEHVEGQARKVVAGRLEDLSAQIVELDRTLRELAQSLEPASVLECPLAEVLQREADSVQARTH